MSKQRFSRRTFLQKTAILGAGVTAPYLIPSGVLAADGRPGANDRIGIGMIGAGRRTHQILREVQRVTSPTGEGRVVAVSDLWPKKALEWIAGQGGLPERRRG